MSQSVKLWICKNHTLLTYIRTPQDHISIDLLGPYSVTSQGTSFTLTAVCNLTGYLMTSPLKDKKTMTVVTYVYLHIMLKFGFPRILHSSNGTEFKSKLIEHLFSKQIGMKKTYISPHHPQANGKLESSHRFIKDYIWKFFSRWCHRMGPITSLCSSCIQLVSKWAFSGITSNILDMTPIYHT